MAASIIEFGWTNPLLVDAGADAVGAKLAAVVRQAVERTGRDDLRFAIQEPFGFKDWNDQLRSKPQQALPCRCEEPSVA